MFGVSGGLGSRRYTSRPLSPKSLGRTHRSASTVMLGLGPILLCGQECQATSCLEAHGTYSNCHCACSPLKVTCKPIKLVIGTVISTVIVG